MGVVVCVKKILAICHLRRVALSACFVLQRWQCRWYYRCHLRRIRKKVSRGGRVKVFFLVNSNTKWKSQLLFEALRSSGRYEPQIGLTYIKGFGGSPREVFERNAGFFASLGDDCVATFNPDTGENFPIEEYKPDIVFPQEPGGASLKGRRVFDYAKHALCCYIPYSLEFCDFKNDLERLPWFHGHLFLNITWCEPQAEYIRKMLPARKRAGAVVGLGHPFFDLMRGASKDDNNGFVIYAPHFSFPAKGVRRFFTFGTFLETGRVILSYAQNHPEIKWVFKPHPVLREELVRTGGWSKAEVDAYYRSWEEIGLGCYSGDYPQLFRQSRALVTDCSSFLLEYPATGRPIIRLIPKELDLFPLSRYNALFDTFYNVQSVEEMLNVFANVLEGGHDEKCEQRLCELAKLNLGGRDNGAAIIAYFDDILKGGLK